MLYLNLSDNSLEVVQTSKGIVGGEKVKACSRKAITEGMIVNGLVVAKDKFLAELKTIFDSGYPKAIRD